MSTTHTTKYNKIKANSKAYKENKTNANRSINITNTIAYVEDIKIDSHTEGSEKEYAVNYVTKNDKCWDEESKQYLVTLVNCKTNNATAEFIEDERRYHSHKQESVAKKKRRQIPNEAFHLFVSFKGKEVPAVKAHEIGIEIANRLAGNEYRAVVSTHTNTDNYHDHILINAYNIDGCHKYPDLWNLAYVFRNVSNKVALENGLDVLATIGGFGEDSLEPDEKTMFDIAEDTRTKNNKNNKKGKMLDIDILKADIKDAVSRSKTKEGFLRVMKKKNYVPYEHYSKNGKINSITFQGLFMNNIRDKKLGKTYRYENIIKSLGKKPKRKLFTGWLYYHNIKPLELMPKPYYEGGYDRLVGGKKPLVIMLIEFFINILKLIIANYSNFKPQFYVQEEYDKIEKTLKEAESIKDLLIKYNIQNLYQLKIDTNKLFKEYAINQSKINRLKTAGRRYKEIIKALKDVEEYKKEIVNKNIKVNEADFKYPDMEEANILENEAKLDPMHWETKSKLLKKLAEKGYMTYFQFSFISQGRAEKMLKFLDEINSDMPRGIMRIDEYNNLSEEEKKELEVAKNASNNNFKTSKWFYRNYSDDEKKVIKQYKKALTIIKNNGLDNEEKKAQFIKENDERLNKIKELISIQETAKGKLTDYNKMKKGVEYTIYENIATFVEEEDLGKINEGKKQIIKQDEKKSVYDYVKSIINSDKVEEYLKGKEEGIVPPIEIIQLVKAKNDIDGKEESPYYYSRETIINDYIKFFLEEIKEKDIEKKEEAVNAEPETIIPKGKINLEEKYSNILADTILKGYEKYEVNEENEQEQSIQKSEEEKPIEMPKVNREKYDDVFEEMEEETDKSIDIKDIKDIVEGSVQKEKESNIPNNKSYGRGGR